MKTKIVRVGNSRGIRIPKLLLEQAGIERDVILEAKEDEIVIRAAKAHPRAGWEEALIADPPRSLTKEEREWLDAPLDKPLRRGRRK